MRTPKGVPYCIDTTEVTQGQYEVFRAAGVPISEQPHTLCNAQRNPSFDPEIIPGIPDMGPICEATDYSPTPTPNAPVVCVTFCDAVGYCAWAGKRLCGVVGRPGETFGDWRDEGSEWNVLKNDPEYDEWYNTCSGGGEREYPYGTESEPERCPVSYEPHPECAVEGTEPPVLAILGGVSEHLDFCSDDGYCYGPGEATGGAADASCSKELVPAGANRYTGFRCCYEFEE